MTTPFTTHDTPLQDRLALAPIDRLMIRATNHTIPVAKRRAELQHAMRAAEGDLPRQTRIHIALDLLAGPSDN